MNSVYLIGRSGLLIHCVEKLLREQFKILGVISSDQKVKEYLIEKQIIHYASIEKALPVLKNNSFDYFLSIVSDNILHNGILTFPKKLAINYHNSLLPKYAGVHINSWVILNQETYHGVTWHVMNDKVDGGDILQQKMFLIDSNDTAATLSFKCFEAALKSFEEIIVMMKNDSFKRVKQNMSRRSYYPKNKVLPNNGLVDWSSKAEGIDKLVRALSVFDKEEQFETVKIVVGKEIYYLTEIEVQCSQSLDEPGTILEIYDDALLISTSSYDISIVKLETSDRQWLSIADLVAIEKLKKGQLLAEPVNNSV
jgi:methionyl-tRNA formyltransferase